MSQKPVVDIDAAAKDVIKREGYAIVPRVPSEAMRKRAANPARWRSFDEFWEALVSEFELK